MQYKLHRKLNSEMNKPALANFEISTAQSGE